MKYDVREACGGDTTIEADSYAEALEKAIEWIQGGEYGDESTYVSIWITDPDGVEQEEEVLCEREPEAPDCLDDHEHDWESPEWLGGCRENPGVWSTGGTGIHSVCVCAHCGVYRHWYSESTPGQYPHVPERTKYEPADNASREWISEVAATA